MVTEKKNVFFFSFNILCSAVGTVLKRYLRSNLFQNYPSISYANFSWITSKCVVFLYWKSYLWIFAFGFFFGLRIYFFKQTYTFLSHILKLYGRIFFPKYIFFVLLVNFDASIAHFCICIYFFRYQRTWIFFFFWRIL